MTLAEITTRLAALGLGTEGVNLFRDFTPPTPNTLIVVREYGGRSAPDVFRFGQSQVYREYPHIRIETRGEPEDYETPRLAAERVYQLISMTSPTLFSGTQYWTITPLQPPFPLEKDGLQRYVFACNFEVFKMVQQDPSDLFDPDAVDPEL